MIRTFLFFIGLLSISLAGYSQQTIQSQKLKVGIFAPLYLDSAFKAESGKLPRISMPGLDFVQGALIALDTIKTSGVPLEVHIFDSRDETRSIPWMIRYGQLDKMNMLIGSVREPEYQELAKFAEEKKIPFISATYPNDGGIRNDPYLVIVNSTLKSHIEGIYSYLVQQHSMNQILLIKRRNDNRIDNIFHEINKGTSKPLLKIRSIAVDSINSSQLAMLIDTTKPAVIIGASLNENFALNIVQACYPLQQTNEISLIGMPNWDGFKDLYNKDKFKDFPILFTTPHTDEDKNAFSDYLGNQYFTKYRARPTDMAYKGFESAYYFINLLMKYSASVMQHLNEDQFACFHTFNFQPVYFSEKTEPDYFENKKVTVVQLLNGVITKKW